MLAALGFATIAILLALILARKMTPLGALISAPVVASITGGFGFKTAGFMLRGIESVAGIAGMFVFAILYFGIMTDAGMLDPIIARVLKAAGCNPVRIVVGTAGLALLAHLDGSGVVTFLVTIPVMLPLYERLGMDKRVLACAASLAAGVNFLPWTGPMIRASASFRGGDFQPPDSSAGGGASICVLERVVDGQKGGPAARRPTGIGGQRSAN
jgi:citrate-Mg2+:H+ or citrate-Ca2+:H+ symporter, CitMHS family